MDEAYVIKMYDSDIFVYILDIKGNLFVKCVREDDNSIRILKVHSTKQGRYYFSINNCRYYLSELTRL